MNNHLPDLIKRFDDVALNVLGPLRTSKRLDTAALAEFKSVLQGLQTELSNQEYVPRKLASELWHVFCSMLAEADHAQNPGPILDEAWDIQERLRRIFGPRW